MIKALLKKQLLEAFSWIYFNAKNGKRRNKKGIMLFALLYIFIFGMVGFVFYTMAASLCEPLCMVGFGWLYFALISLISIVFGVFGSVFNTYSSLYKPKDNDLLLSMPIPAAYILIMRLAGVYIMGLLYESIVMIPSLIAWFIYGDVSIAGAVLSLIIPFILSLFVLTLSAVLGWVIAVVSRVVKNESFVTVFISISFLAGYYYFYFNANTMLTSILANPSVLGRKIKSILYPLYHLGLAAEGKILSMFIFTGIVSVLFLVVFYVLSRSFLKLATYNKGNKKATFKTEQIKTGSPDRALLNKELKRFLSSSTYILNCGLGILFMVAAAVFLLIKGEMLANFIPLLYDGAEELVPLIITAAVCFMSSMNDISAPSVSLEGNNIWILKVYPVSPFRVLKAKLKLHIYLTLPCALLLTVCGLIVFKPSVFSCVAIAFAVILFNIFMALFGLWLNLKMPNLNWKNEAVPIKQSMSVTLAIFGSWGIVTALGIVYFLLRKWISPIIFLVLAIFVLFLTDSALYLWIKKRGCGLFEQL